MSDGATLVLSVVMMVFGPNLISLFATDETVISLGASVLRVCGPFYVTYTLIEILSGAIRGSGQGFAPMAITLTTICRFRLIWAFFIAPMLGGTVQTIAACYPATWILAGLTFVVYYMGYRKKFAVGLNDAI